MPYVQHMTSCQPGQTWHDADHPAMENAHCVKKTGMQAHVMSGCYIVLSSGRYTWHHIRGLKWLVDMIDVAQNKAAASLSPCHKMVSFIKEGDKPSLRMKMLQPFSI